jgi:hypothetical protein
LAGPYNTYYEAFEEDPNTNVEKPQDYDQKLSDGSLDQLIENYYDLQYEYDVALKDVEEVREIKRVAD